MTEDGGGGGRRSPGLHSGAGDEAGNWHGGGGVMLWLKHSPGWRHLLCEVV